MPLGVWIIWMPPWWLTWWLIRRSIAQSLRWFRGDRLYSSFITTLRFGLGWSCSYRLLRLSCLFGHIWIISSLKVELSIRQRIKPLICVRAVYMRSILAGSVGRQYVRQPVHSSSSGVGCLDSLWQSVQSFRTPDSSGRWVPHPRQSVTELKRVPAHKCQGWIPNSFLRTFRYWIDQKRLERAETLMRVWK